MFCCFCNVEYIVLVYNDDIFDLCDVFKVEEYVVVFVLRDIYMLGLDGSDVVMFVILLVDLFFDV